MAGNKRGRKPGKGLQGWHTRQIKDSYTKEYRWYRVLYKDEDIVTKQVIDRKQQKYSGPVPQ